jgi:transcriptional regulator with XRE-family HTH domain
MKIFAKNLRYLRRQKLLSQDALARGIGLNRGNIASYEKGTAEPNYNNLIKFARFFQVDIADLIQEDLESNSEIYDNLKDMEESGNSDPDSENLMERQFHERLVDNRDKLDQFRRRSDEMARILDGFRQFHKFKMESSEEISDDVKRMADDYEKLMDVLEDVLKTNMNLLEVLGIEDPVT